MASSHVNLEDFSPCFLVAAPQMQDPHFHRTVILLLEYHTEGAMGLVINRPLNVTLGSVQSPTAIIADDYQENALWYGGPLGSDHILCLYETPSKPLSGDSEVGHGIAIAASGALLASATERSHFPGAYRILAGHAGWQPKQLDAEIHAGVWLVTPVQPPMIFADNPDGVWNAAIRLLGIDPIHYHDTPSGAAH